MPTIHVEVDAQVSPIDLLKAVEQLSPPELERFVDQVLAVRARRLSNPMSATDSQLLLQINQPFPGQARYDELMGKRRDETLTPDEHTELLQLTEAAERLQVERVNAIIELGKMQKKTVDEVMKDLGISTFIHD